MADVIYKRGQSADLNNVAIKDGQILITEDTAEMYVDMSDNTRKKISGSGGGIGQATTEGGEIFNDYGNNQAISQLTHAEGKKTTAGSKAFTITDVDKNNKRYKLDSVDGLNIGDIYSAHILYTDNTSEQVEDYGTITAIIGNWVTVDNFKCEKEFLDYPAYMLMEDGYDTEKNTFRIKAKPNVGTRNIGFMTHAEGYQTMAISKAAHAEGRGTIAYGSWSHAEGNKTIAHYSAHSEGVSTKALGESSHAEGKNNTSSGSASHSEGENNTASGDYSHAEGYNTKAKGQHSHVEGLDSNAEGQTSHAEGRYTFSKGDYSHAEGDHTQANGKYSHAEGCYTEALSSSSHAEGDSTKAEGWTSHAEGRGTIAKNAHSHAEGSFNNVNKSNVLNLFNGVSNTDAGVTVTSLGQVEFDLSVGETDSHYRIFALNDNFAGQTLSSLHLIFKLNTPIEFYIYALTDLNKISEAGGKTELHWEKISTVPSDNIFKFVKDDINIPEDKPYLAFKFRHVDTTNSNEKITMTYAAINDKKTIDTNVIHSVGNGSSDKDRRNAFSVFKDGHAEVQIQGETDNSIVQKQYVDVLIARIEKLEAAVIAMGGTIEN